MAAPLHSPTESPVVSAGWGGLQNPRRGIVPHVTREYPGCPDDVAGAESGGCVSPESVAAGGVNPALLLIGVVCPGPPGRFFHPDFQQASLPAPSRAGLFRRLLSSMGMVPVSRLV